MREGSRNWTVLDISFNRDISNKEIESIFTSYPSVLIRQYSEKKKFSF